ncbi:chromate efflux transporter [Vibrio marisflavi]|uniref:Chromate transport protein n=1 Tax=Vibrio marisflavi CECT 7928 TaxID=634439 RepID=A0ABM9A7P9_9VIBR|nr:chromate efflux transporter [Vibrio marisflavi]CAH0541181.1 putative chromate transport protein [Vibrio marisflavi CECT 7928]
MFSIFRIFFGLGCLSFGGPAAHIGYFRTAFVEKLKWLSEKEYAQLVALSQFLPGPASSQVGFALSYKKGGLGGALAAFLGFTLPSVVLMLALAIVAQQINDSSYFQNVVHGLKLLAVVVVADATWGMFKNFCTSKLTTFLCFITAASLLLAPSVSTQLYVLVFSALIGGFYLSSSTIASKQESRSNKLISSLFPLAIFGFLLLVLPLFSLNAKFSVFNDFFQAGSLVFGGGHVALPLLQNIVGEQLSQNSFLTGYAAAQAVPGPMFSFATYLGYELLPSSPFAGALLATVAIFLPGFLLILAAMPHWQTLSNNTKLAGVMNGVNASVVGLLLSALYTPISTSAIHSPVDIVFILALLFLFKTVKLPIGWIVCMVLLSSYVAIVT